MARVTLRITGTQLLCQDEHPSLLAALESHNVAVEQRREYSVRCLMIYKNEALNMVPVVALVGRPNVGKSTLFNRLTRTRDALVADFPGLTRDRKYGRAEIEGREFICIDTGGIDGTEDGVETRMAEQSLLAIEEADVVLFMVDARAGLMPADEAIAKHLRSREKPTFLVANKIDGLDPDQAVVDFYSLGLGEIYPIAASHGRGVLSLLEHVLLPWMEDLAPLPHRHS